MYFRLFVPRLLYLSLRCGLSSHHVLLGRAGIGRGRGTGRPTVVRNVRVGEGEYRGWIFIRRRARVVHESAEGHVAAPILPVRPPPHGASGQSTT